MQGTQVHRVNYLLTSSLGTGYGFTDDLTIGLRLPYVLRTDIRESSLYEENIEPRGLRDPEAGEGGTIHFQEGCTSQSRPLQIAVAIPDDAIIIVNEVTLLEGSTNFLVLEPVYGATTGRQRPGFYGQTSFSQGMKGFKAYLNGRPL